MKSASGEFDADGGLGLQTKLVASKSGEEVCHVPKNRWRKVVHAGGKGHPISRESGGSCLIEGMAAGERRRARGKALEG